MIHCYHSRPLERTRPTFKPLPSSCLLTQFLHAHRRKFMYYCFLGEKDIIQPRSDSVRIAQGDGLMMMVEERLARRTTMLVQPDVVSEALNKPSRLTSLGYFMRCFALLGCKKFGRSNRTWTESCWIIGFRMARMVYRHN
jgi:hypothetical protein